MLPIFQVDAKIEILDRVAIIVEDGVVLESQVNKMMGNIRKRYKEQGAALPPKEILLEQVHERLIVIEGIDEEREFVFATSRLYFLCKTVPFIETSTCFKVCSISPPTSATNRSPPLPDRLLSINEYLVSSISKFEKSVFMKYERLDAC